MREIKFRAWDGVEMRSDLHGGDDLNKFFSEATIPVMQYTGFKDADGVEIFDDDIFECHGAIYDLIKHDGGCYELHERGSGKVFFLFNHHKSIKIIGNKHANPELLELIRPVKRTIGAIVGLVN